MKNGLISINDVEVTLDAIVSFEVEYHHQKQNQLTRNYIETSQKLAIVIELNSMEYMGCSYHAVMDEFGKVWQKRANELNVL